MFQFTHPGGVRLHYLNYVFSTKRFNSRTREGCDGEDVPPREAIYIVSIHAPGRGATYADIRAGGVCQGFNSRTREGCDARSSDTRARAIKFQFTHPGGVRQVDNPSNSTETCFNSRTREGCDHCAYATSPSSLQFQFTHPGGVRPETLHRNTPMKSFNSRTREGCDRHHHCSWEHRSAVSIHAPGRGATAAQAEYFNNPLVSIHAPGRGATIYIRRCAVLTSCFNSRTREGCDSKLQTLPAYKSQFQFTHPGGVRLPAGVGRSQAEWVSIHAPGRGATCQGTHSY